jgi:hypothetical protein
MEPDQLDWLPAGATPEMLAAEARGRHACERRSQGCVLLARHRRRIWISLRLHHLGAQRPEACAEKAKRLRRVPSKQTSRLLHHVRVCRVQSAASSGGGCSAAGSAHHGTHSQKYSVVGFPLHSNKYITNSKNR